MDVKLVGTALQYHGKELLVSMTEEHGEAPSSNVMSYLHRGRPAEPEIKDKVFQRNLMGFIARKSDLLFRPLTEEEKAHSKTQQAIDDAFAIMPPVETFMKLPSYTRRERFWKSLQVDDCVTGVVSSIVDQGLRLTLLCVDKGAFRDVEDLDIPAFCPVKELPKLYAKEDALDAFQKRDIVRGIVLSVHEDTERIIISLRPESVPDEKNYPRVGLITEDDLPVHHRRLSQIQDMSYEEMLQSILGFNNTGNVAALTNQLAIPSQSSYYRFFSRLKIPEKEFAEGLKKWQSQKLAHQSVVQGVEMFKKGDYLEAMQHLNKALQIDEDNVEALVARGALLEGMIEGAINKCYRYANKESFTNAVKDFERALSVNPKHNNARNYLMETLLTMGKMSEDGRELEKAVTLYEKVLKMDPDHREAVELLRGCQQLMAIQPANKETEKAESKRDKKMTPPRSDGGEDSTLLKSSTEKLKALIKEDNERKPRSSKKGKHHRSPSSSSSRERKKRKQKKKRKKRTRSSSTSSSSNSESDSSRSRSSSRDSSRRTRKKKKLKDRKQRKSKRSRKQSITEGRGLRNRSPSPKEKEDKKSKEKETEREGELRARAPDKEKLTIEKAASLTEEIDEDKAEGDFFSKTAPMSYLPVSSFDFFSKSTAIPGLASPSPPHQTYGINQSLDAFKRSPIPYLQSVYTSQQVGTSKNEQGRQHETMKLSPPSRSSDSRVGSLSQGGSNLGLKDFALRDGSGQRDLGQIDGSGIREFGQREGSRNRDGELRALENSKGEPKLGVPSFNDFRREVQGDDFSIREKQSSYVDGRDGAHSRGVGSRHRSRSRSSSGSRPGSRRRGRSRSRSLTPGRQRINSPSRGQRSQSSSRSGSPRRRREDWSRSPSVTKQRSPDSPGKSPVITGNKELDRYLGGAKILIQRAIEAKGYSSWEDFIAKAAPKSPKTASRSPRRTSRSPKRKSISPKRYFSRSPKRDLRSPPRRGISRSPTHQRYRGRSPSPTPKWDKRSASPYKSTRSPSDRRVRSPSPIKRTRSPPPAKQRSRSPKMRRGSDSPSHTTPRSPPKRTIEPVKRSGRWDRKPEQKQDVARRDEDQPGRSGFLQQPTRDEGRYSPSRQEVGSFGKFGPKGKAREEYPKQTEDTGWRELKDVGPEAEKEDREGSNGHRQDGDARRTGKSVNKPAVSSNDPGQKEKAEKQKTLRKPHMDDSELKKSFLSSKDLESKTKAEPASFMPRILRKPRMDDPELNKPLMSSNEIEREKRKLKEKLLKEKLEKEKAISESKKDGKLADRKEKGSTKNEGEQNKKGESVKIEDKKQTVASSTAGKSDKEKDLKDMGNKGKNGESLQPAAEPGKGSDLEEYKKTLQEQMEKEIERRVKERLQEQMKKSDSVGDGQDKRRGTDIEEEDRRARQREDLRRETHKGHHSSRYKSYDYGYGRGRYKERSGDEDKGRDRSKSRSGGGESDDRGDKSQSSKRKWDSRLSRYRSKSKSRSRSRERARSKGSGSKSPVKPEEVSSTSGGGKETDGSKEPVTTEATKTEEVETLTRSRWDDGGEGGKQTDGNASKSNKSGESLTDLEKFLVDLKQQKKKQWIAEGKIKEK